MSISSDGDDGVYDEDSEVEPEKDAEEDEAAPKTSEEDERSGKNGEDDETYNITATQGLNTLVSSVVLTSTSLHSFRV
jgi:hypothetical protein